MLLKGPLVMAMFGLAINVLLWSVPLRVGASALPHQILPGSAPTLAEALARIEPPSSSTVDLQDALLQLIGAESEAMQVVGDALQQPVTADLASRANHAGMRVQQAVTTYVASARAVLH